MTIGASAMVLIFMSVLGVTMAIVANVHGRQKIHDDLAATSAETLSRYGRNSVLLMAGAFILLVVSGLAWRVMFAGS